MSTNCFAQVLYESDGVNKAYAVPFPYLRKEHVKVFVAGAEVAAADFSWTSPSVIDIDTQPPLAAQVIIVRQTPRSSLIDTLTAPSTLSAREQNLIFTQLLYLVQEALCPSLEDYLVDFFITLYGVRNFEEGDILGPVPIARPMRIPAGAVASQVACLDLPLTDHVFRLKVNDVIKGTLTISSLGVFTWSVATAIDLVEGDVLWLETFTVGGSIDNVGVTIRAARTDIL